VPTTLALIGGGSWATAITKLLCENDVRVRWWLRSKPDMEHILKYGHNPSYLSSVKLDPAKVQPLADLNEALHGAELAILCVPAAYIPDVLAQVGPGVLAGKTLVSAIKGMIPGQNQLVTDYVAERFVVPIDNFLVIAGPCHAEEVALEKLSYLTIGGQDLAKADHLAALLRSRYLRTSVIADVNGAEYCAVMKNIIAVACGISHGLNYGDNFQAVLVANAMQEIRRFVEAVVPMPTRDMNASAYLGDLLVTTYSQFSRNRTFGNMIGRGYSVKAAQLEMNMVAEGYFAVKCIYELNQQFKVPMPIVKAVYHILYERISPTVEFKILKDVLK
jgi:glycerol-3-phosphate dehydrogenase (NAD(P)+)